MKLEPAHRDTKCRVQKFVDNGPGDPGPARRSGRIHVGDFLVKVNGKSTNNYLETIQMLKDNAQQRRTLTFQQAHQGALRTKKKIVPGVVKYSTTKSSLEVPMGAGPDAENQGEVSFAATDRQVLEEALHHPSTNNVSPSQVKQRVAERGGIFQSIYQSLGFGEGPDHSVVKKTLVLQELNEAVASLDESLEWNKEALEDELESLQSTVQQSGRVQELQQQLLAVQRELQDAQQQSSKVPGLQDQVKDLSSSCREQKELIDLLQKQIEAMQKSYRRMQDDMKAQSEEANGLMETNQQLTTDRTELTVRVEELEARLEQVQEELRARDEAVLAAQAERDQARRNTEEYRAIVSTIETECDLSRAMDEKNQTELRACVSSLQVALDEANRAKSANEEHLQKLQATLQLYETDRKESQQMRHEKEEAANELAKQLQTTQKELTALQAKTKKLPELEALPSQIDKLLEEKFALIQSLEKARYRIESLRATGASPNGVSPELDALRKEHQDLVAECISLREENSRSKESEARLAGELRAAQEELSEILTSSQGNKARSERSQRELHAEARRSKELLRLKDEELQHAQEILGSVRQDKHELTEQLSDLRHAWKEANRRMEQLESEKCKLEFSYRQLQKNQADGESSNFAGAHVLVETKIVELRTDLMEANMKLETLQSKYDSTSGRNRYLEELKTDLESKVSRLLNTLQERDEQLVVRRNDLTDSQQAVEELQNSYDRTKRELFSTRETLKKLSKQYEVMRAQVSQSISATSRSNELLSAELTTCREELLTSRARCSELDRLLRSMRKSVCDAERRAAEAREHLHSDRTGKESTDKFQKESTLKLFAKTKQLEDALKKEKAAVVGLKREKDAVERELRQSRGQLTSSQSTEALQRVELQSKVSDLAVELNIAANSLSKEQERTKSLRAELATVEQARDQLERQMESLQQKLREESSEVVAELESKLRSQTKQIELLQEQSRHAAAIDGATEDSKSHAQSLEKSQQELRVQIDSLQLQLTESHRLSTKKMQAAEVSYQESLRRLRSEKKSLEESIRSAEERQTEFKTLLAGYEERVASLRADNSRLVAENGHLRASIDDVRNESTMSTLGDLDLVDTSSDSDQDEFSGLSPSVLRHKCRSLLEKLQRAESNVSDATADANRKTNHIQRLEADLGTLSLEIEKLLELNEDLEVKASQARDAEASAEAHAESLKSELDRSVLQNSDVGSEAEQLRAQNDALSSRVLEMERDVSASAEEHRAKYQRLHDQVASLTSSLSRATNEVERFESVKTVLQTEIAALTKSRAQAAARSRELEGKIVDLEAQVEEVSHARDTIKSKHEEDKRESASAVDSLEEKVAYLRERISELELEVDCHQSEVHRKTQELETLSGVLDNQKEANIVLEQDASEARRQFSEAKQQLLAADTAVGDLEQRAATAESSAEQLAAQVETLKVSLAKMEASSESSTISRAKRVQELEDQCIALERIRTVDQANLLSIREELQLATSSLNEQQRANAAIRKKVDELTRALREARDDSSNAQAGQQDAVATSKRLESELDCKQMEIDRLKTNIQVLNSTVARMKSEYAELQESALKTELRAASGRSQGERSADTKAEIHTMRSKLQSLTQVYQSQQQVLALSQSLEEQLLFFIEEVMAQVDESLDSISRRLQYLENLDRSQHVSVIVNALDLQGMKSIRDFLPSLKKVVTDLSLIVPESLLEMKHKHAQLKEWKSRRKSRIAKSQKDAASPVTSRVGKQGSCASSPDVKDSFQKIKSALNEQALSPSKLIQQNGSLDTEYLQGVIHSLEGQIDGLLAELKSANDALHAKEALFADLESLLSHHETQKDSLESQIATMSAQIGRLEEQLNSESSYRRDAEQALAEVSLRDAKSSGESKLSSSEKKRMTVECMLSVAHRRAVLEQGVTFRKWSNRNTAIATAERQRHIAAALTEQLDITRQKLGHLKRHLKNTTGRSRPPALDRIAEGYETS